MDINIYLTDSKPKKRNNVLVVKGEIKIGDFQELLYIPLDWWSLDQYKKQWEEGLVRLITHDASCLVVGIHNPHIRPFIDWWKMYKIGEKIYIRNQWIFNETYQELIGNNAFTVETCYNFIPPRGDTYTEDGYKISEWTVDCHGK